MTRFKYLGIFVIALAIGVMHFIGALSVVERPIVQLVSRGAEKAYSIRENIVRIANEFRNPNQNDEQCRQRTNALLKENAELLLAKSENETLRRELHFLKSASPRLVGAHVIGFSTDNAQNSIVIDKGSRDGVQNMRAVITDDGILIGKTSNVSENISHVLLLTDNHSKIIGTILARKTATGILSGEYQIGLKMDLIPITEKIANKDIVVTAGIEDNIPAGLLIGEISEIKTRPTDFYQTASIRPFVNSSDLRVVSVVQAQ